MNKLYTKIIILCFIVLNVKSTVFAINELDDASNNIRMELPYRGSTSSSGVVNCLELADGEGLVPDAIEMQALKAFYESTGGPNWTFDTGWPSLELWPDDMSVSDIDWTGVTVRDGDVVQLLFFNYGLNGTLPEAIGDLKALEWFIAILNRNLVGPIPERIGELSNLTVMQLYNCNFGGELPASLGQLQNLTTLTLWGNNFEGELPSAMGDMASLESFYVQDNDIVGGVPVEFAQLTNLRELELSNNQITSVPRELFSLPKLEFAYLKNNALTTFPNLIGLEPTEEITIDIRGNEVPYSYIQDNLDVQNFNILYDLPQGFTDLLVNQSLTYTPQYNGNIAAVKWKNSGDNNEHVYAYHYDAMNRITDAHYAEGVSQGNNWTTTKAQGGYSVTGIGYDLNGNIQTLNRQAIDTDIQTIDALNYTYKNGNQLSSVSDNARLAGFSDGLNEGDDYAYDANGNMIQDLNKGIIDITYNYLNLPEKVLKDDGQYIKYIYDATGVKLAQEVYDANDNLVKRTDYIGEFIYEQQGEEPSALQFIQHEEGRIVPDATTGEWEYQYNLKDHLGNTRLTFTTKPKTLHFTNNYEGTGDDDQELFEEVTVIQNDIFDHTDAAGTAYNKAQMLNGASGSQVGAVITIPVAAGDTISASVYAKYIEITPDATNATTTIASALISAYTGATGGSVVDGGASTIGDNFNQGSLIGQPGFPVIDNGAPRAFINVMYLPEGESIDLVNEASFAYDQIDINATQPIGQPKNGNFDKLQVEDFVAPGKGYVMVYLSNESTTLTEVYFDDIDIAINESPIIQTDDYYPFGLTFNSYQRVTAKENDFKYNGKELINDLDIGWYAYGARNYDASIGRFFNVDRFAEKYYSSAPYHYALNNPILYVDMNGDSTILNGFLKWAKGQVTPIGVGIVNLAEETANGNYKPLLNMVSAAHLVKDKVDRFQNGDASDKTEVALETVTDIVVAAVAVKGSTVSASEAEASGIKAVQSEVDATVSTMQKTGQSPATVVGGRLPNGATKVGSSGAPPSTVATSLENAANKIGGVGAERAGNIIGCCGEFRLGNQLLLENPGYKPTDIKFTPAVRPRTGQVIPPCQNCQDIFNIKP